MKTMKCKDLGGPEDCEVEFKAETFEEMAEMSKNHGMEMFQKQDEAHLKAMNEMKLKGPEIVGAWMEEKKKEFDEMTRKIQEIKDAKANNKQLFPDSESSSGSCCSHSHSDKSSHRTL